MKLTSKFSRIAVAAACAAGLSGLVAVPADAAVNTPVVTPATSITPESAMIGAAIDTGNLAPGTSYTFEYDTLSDWNAGGDNALFAGPFFADASPSLAFVSTEIGCFPAATCTPENTPLTPGTTYVYSIQSQPGVSGSYFATQTLTSINGQFTTPSLGAIAVKSKVAAVARGRAAIVLKCTGAMACTGDIKIVLGKKTLGKGTYSVPAGATEAVSVKLKAFSLAGALLSKVELTSTSDQKNVKAAIKLA
jgi:hypothetical protein